MIVARLAADMNLLITDGRVCLTRILSSGETDATFGAGGTLVVPVAGIDWRSDLGITPWQGGIAIGVKAQPDANLPDVFRRNRFTAVLVDESGAIRTGTGDSGRVSLTVPGEAVTLSGIVAGASRLFLFGAGGIPTPVLAVAAMDDAGPVASFASGGFAKFDPLPMRGASLLALAAQGSDRIVAVGSAAGYGLAARFHLDGRLDTTFGEQGLSYFRLGENYSGASAVAALPDGRLLVAGWGWVPRDTNGYSGTGMSVARLLPDGRQDFTFGNGGWSAGCLACRGTGTSEFARAIRVLADGSVLLAGGGGSVGVTAKFTAEGLADLSYVPSRNPYGFPVDGAQLLSSSGALSVAGTLSSLAGTSFAVTTVSPSGAWGPLTQLPGPSSREVAAGMRLQSDARLLLAGTSGSPATSLAVKRTLPVAAAAGTTLDPTFGIGGTALLTLPGFNTSGASVEVDGAGHIIAAGAAIGVADTSDRALLVARFLANGALDAAFGSQGYLRLPLPVARSTIAPALLRQRDDGFIVGNGTDEGLFLARVASSQPANVADLDGDGMPDALERGLGFDPFVRDNDLFSPGLGSAYLFAMQQYRDFLGREADGGGLRGWAEAVANGSYTRAQVIDAFLSSEEFAGGMAPVVRLYFATFLRTPDYDGLMFNAGLVRDGTISLAQLADFFAASPEFAAHYGALGNAQFVTLLYANILGRAPDAAGLAAWTAVLDAGACTRGQVLLGFSESAENRSSIASEVLVTMMYAGMLRRSPDAAGFGGWVSLLDGGMARTQVIDGFFLSSEYRARFLP